jgi:hypothetical protein
VRKSNRNSFATPRGKDPVESVRRINRRWIVHGGLRESAAAYFAQLEKSDPDRLRRSCQLAMDLVHSKLGHADPKPWFYAGLFAHAGHDEAERFLTDHTLTRLVWETLHGIPHQEDAPEGVRVLGRQIVQAIRCQ